MLLSLRIFRIIYTWKQFILLMGSMILYSVMASGVLYSLDMKIENMSLYVLLLIACLEFGLMYILFRVLRISITWLKYIGIMSIQIIFVMIIGIIPLFFSVFVNHGASMLPMLFDGDTVLVNKGHYLVVSPKYNDVIVLESRVSERRRYSIKRVIAIPGDTIRFESGSVFLKTGGSNEFQKFNEPFLSESNKDKSYIPEYIEESEFLIPPDSYWVMGDHRQNSADSRQCFQNCFGLSIESHYIPRENIIGKVIGKF